MIITAFRELISRRTATGLAALGLLTATLGFMVLASTSKTTEAVLTGDISSAWASPYDILVRPPGAALPLEQTSSLVRPNFLSASPSGISLQQLNAVRAIPGVDVAAPIAVVGVTQLYSLSTSASVPVDLSQLMGGAPIVAFRATPTLNADGGYSHYPMPQITMVVALGGTYDIGTRTLTVGSQIIPCTKVLCFGGKAICSIVGLCPDLVAGDQQRAIGLAPGRPGANLPFAIPLTIVGVDPEAENKLSGIAKCLTSGHYLQPSTSVIAPGALPILLSDRSLLDESISVTIARTTAVAPLIKGQDPAALAGWQSEGTRTIDPNLALQNANLEAVSAVRFPNVSPIWMPGPIQYTSTAAGALAPSAVLADPTAYSNPFVENARPDFYMPVEAQDVWFRNLQDRYQTGRGGPGKQWDVVGRFNPSCIPSFNGSGAGQMGTFVSPVVRSSDGKPIGPNRSIAGYLDSPPLMLTTLQGAEYFADPTTFAGAPGPKFISAIRVKVAGTNQLGKPAQERLSRVAAQIQDATGLQVDIVKGSSPRPLQIALPAGKFGRPALLVTQGWASKGVAFRFFQAVSFQNLAIFAVVLVGALILVAQTAYVSVRRRRSELGVLRAVGWPPWRIALLIELEMLFLGLAVGAVGLAVGVPLTVLTHLGQTWWTIAGVVPLSVLIALLAGLIPAAGSMRGTTLSVITKQEPIRERQLPSSSLALGLRQVMVWRWDVAMGIAALALGAALLAGIELLSAGFRGQLDTTLLGTYLSGQVMPFHVVVAGLTLAVGAIAAAQVITLTYLERRAQLATLRALGWPRSAVVKMLLGQAVGLGLIAAVIAVAITVAAGLALSASPIVISGSALTALAMSVIATAIAVIAPLSHAYGADPATGLREE